MKQRLNGRVYVNGRKKMPASFLKRHRTICAVILEIREHAVRQKDLYVIQLCNEAETYAKAMSAKLALNKQTIEELLEEVDGEDA